MSDNKIELEELGSASSLENETRVLNPKEVYDTQKSNDPYQQSKSLKFIDGIRKIDMIICYQKDEIEDSPQLSKKDKRRLDEESEKQEKREIFERNLKKQKLELETVEKENSADNKTTFIKIYMPPDVEHKYAEAFKMDLAVKNFKSEGAKDDNSKKNESCFCKIRRIFEYNKEIISKEPSFYDEISQSKSRQIFLMKNRHQNFNDAQRSALVMQILLRTKYTDDVDNKNSNEKVGIQNLINAGVYSGCFPLHEDDDDKAETPNDRTVLIKHWANIKNWYKKQPLWFIRKYFGEKIALYFCWLEFYTIMLTVPAIVGLICFFYGVFTMHSAENVVSGEICNATGMGNTTLCPLCFNTCSYIKLKDSCTTAKISYLFDNPATVFFAIFMSFWATIFLELWKRKQSVVVWEWDMKDVEQNEVARPEYELSAKKFRNNPVTKQKEPYVSFWTKTSRIMLSISGVLTMVTFVLAAFLAVIIYRVSIVGIIYGGKFDDLKKHAKMFTTISASLLNLVLIMTMTRVYRKIAEKLTEFENPRTQTDYEDSYAFKIFVLEFNNFYGSLIYIAFFKGQFYNKPNDAQYFNLRADVCGHTGCLIDLCIQLAIIMIGKQIVNNLGEYFVPKLKNWWRSRGHKSVKDDPENNVESLTAWERDYSLQDLSRLPLFEEYKELIIQYGFVTLFVAAFPLAPLFALLNNIFESRLDANKLIKQSRRPLAERVEDIGAWFGILEIITQIAIASNAFVIAFTSDFIPKMIYKFYISETPTLVGYVNYTLKPFNITDEFKSAWGSTSDLDPDVCYYRGFKSPYDNKQEPFGQSIDYWHIMFARLAFVVIFEHVVFLLTKLMEFVIPDVPRALTTQIKYEQLDQKEKLLK